MPTACDVILVLRHVFTSLLKMLSLLLVVLLLTPPTFNPCTRQTWGGRWLLVPARARHCGEPQSCGPSGHPESGRQWCRMCQDDERSFEQVPLVLVYVSRWKPMALVLFVDTAGGDDHTGQWETVWATVAALSTGDRQT